MCNEVRQPQPSSRALDVVSARCFVSLCVDIGSRCGNSLHFLAEGKSNEVHILTSLVMYYFCFLHLDTSICAFYFSHWNNMLVTFVVTRYKILFKEIHLLFFTHFCRKWSYLNYAAVWVNVKLDHLFGVTVQHIFSPEKNKLLQNTVGYCYSKCNNGSVFVAVTGYSWLGYS